MLIAAAADLAPPGPAAVPTLHYRDAPYVLRDPDSVGVPVGGGGLHTAGVAGTLAAKLDACACYATQLGFQFGGEPRMRRMLTDFAADEAARAGRPGDRCERFAPGRTPPPAFPSLA